MTKKPAPKKTVAFTLRLSRALVERLDAECVQRRIAVGGKWSRSDVVAAVLQGEFEESAAVLRGEFKEARLPVIPEGAFR